MTVQTVNDKLISALSKQAMVWKRDITDMQLHFSLDKMEDMHYKVFADGKLLKNVGLADIIGNNIYNAIVKSYLKKTVKRAADLIKAPYTDTAVIAGTKDGKIITITVQQNDKTVRQLLITDIYV